MYFVSYNKDRREYTINRLLFMEYKLIFLMIFKRCEQGIVKNKKKEVFTTF